ncbi:MAG: phage tail assembly chaperone [Parvibaculales bacterium]
MSKTFPFHGLLQFCAAPSIAEFWELTPYEACLLLSKGKPQSEPISKKEIEKMMKHFPDTHSRKEKR